MWPWCYVRIMSHSYRSLATLLGITCTSALVAVACSDGGINYQATSGSMAAGSGGDGAAGATQSAAAFGDGSTTGSSFDVEPAALQTIDVPLGMTAPTLSYAATLDGQPVNTAWSVDRGNIGTVQPGPSATSLFTPKGTTGGLLNVVAGSNGQTLERQILVRLNGTQNGADPTNPAEQPQIATTVGGLKAGGGIGGVGGEGLGVAVTDQATLDALASPSDPTTQGLSLVYPYDKTIWPRGMLAPLLMWDWALADADAISIELHTASGSFSWTGTFGKPDILSQTGGAFIRHPIPQDVWDAATSSAGGPTSDGSPDTLTLSLTVAEGGAAYGPIEQTWRVAPGRLTGSVYYNSYGTQYVKNWAALDGAGHSVGAAILGVRSGDVAPTLIVGQNSPVNAQGNPADDSGCRVCHVVASRGRWLVTQSEQGSPGDGRSFLYDLTASDVQGSVAQIPQEGQFGWAAMTGDATYALTNTINPSSSNPAINGSSGGTAVSSFWQFGASPTAATANGLPDGTSAGYPGFSPDDKMIAWVDVAGSTQNVQGTIKVADYDPATLTFSNITDVAAPTGVQRMGYPVFSPDNKSLLFETQVRTSQSDTVMVTRNGTRSELWASNLEGTPTPIPMLALNGKNPDGTSYLHSGPNNHGVPGAYDPRSSYDETGYDDTTLNYEPTVLPLVSGGYAWVVFTSRREYGNQLTAVPWKSWPPDYDTTSLEDATVKKLWVAAIDLDAPPGSDPSHPAFYLPAQEILAGNSRGFWVLDPCKADGDDCESGDQCCNGYCEPDSSQNLVCSNIPPGTNCSGLQEICTTAADCCDPTNQCINGFCAQVVPQ